MLCKLALAGTQEASAVSRRGGHRHLAPMAKKRAKQQPAFEKRKEPAPNLFETLHSKKRFDVLGRKSKGDVRNVSRLRTAAAEKRKSTLLVEYKQLRKSNAFIDRRFGEDDESLTADEKAILRFQKQRLKELAGGKFVLPDEAEEGEGPGEELTHLGRSLAELNDVGPGWASDDDEDGGLGEALVRDLHFGGGLFERKERRAGGQGEEAEEEEEVEERPAKKSKKEVMEEIIAKSKAAKAQRAQQHEEDLNETQRLDDAFHSLLADPALLGLIRKKGVKISNKGDTEEDRRFDVMTKELVFEAKAQPGDRTLTAEELAEQERARLERLEAQRMQRMQGGGAEDEDEFEDEDGEYDGGTAPAGGYAVRRARREARRAKRAEAESGDALEDEFGSGSEGVEEGGSEEEGEEEDGLTALEQRQRGRAAGDHPLQGAFREASAKLLEKFGVQPEGAEEAGEGEEPGSDEEGRELEGDGEGVGRSEEEAGSEGEMEGGESESENEEEVEEGKAKASVSVAAAAQEPMQKGTAAARAAAGVVAAAAEAAAAPHTQLSFTPGLPLSYEEFAEVAEGLSAEDLGELVRRIRAYNAPSLTTEHRKRAQLLYGVLVQHFATLAGRVPLPLPQLDALVMHLIELTPEVPFYAATLARARLARTQQRMAAALRSPDPAQRAAAWPAPRALLLLKLWASVFPVTDKRHPVLTPASLLAGGCLALCPLAKPHQVGLGLCLASIMLHLHSQARRYVPEPLAFAVALLETALPPPSQYQPRGAVAAAAAAAPQQGPAGGGIGEEEPRWLLVPAASDLGVLPATAAEVQPLGLQRLLSLATAASASASGEATTAAAAAAAEAEEYFSSNAFKTSAAAAAVNLMARCAEVFADVAALSEVLAPAAAALRRILEAGEDLAARQQRQRQQQQSGGKSKAGKQRGKQQGGQVQQPQQPEGQEQEGGLPFALAPGLLEVCREVLGKVEAASEAARRSRKPLVTPALMKTQEAKQFNPRYEENYAAGKDYDPDRERAERRRLQRQLRKEERGAARELRKDAAFMAGVRDRDKAAKQAELDQSARRAFSFLQQQEADFKSGGQGGMWKKGKRGRR